MRLTLPSTLVAVVLSAAPASAADRWAVLIGINGYQEVGRLRSCAEDAKALAQALIERAGYKDKTVFVLTDGAPKARRPTFLNIHHWIITVAANAGPSDSVLVFFAGHAATRRTKSSGREEQLLIPIDGSVNQGPLLGELRGHLDKSRARAKLLILDCGHAGSGMKGIDSAALGEQKAGTTVLTSCVSGQASHWDPNSGHTVFTTYLLEGLSGRADANGDAGITTAELYQFVTAEMLKWREATGRSQTPRIYPSEFRDLPLAAVEGRAIEPVADRPSAEQERTRLRRKLDEQAENAFASTKAAADALLRSDRFGRALEFYDGFPANYRYTKWQERVDDEKQLIRQMALERFQKDKERADALIAQRKPKEAREVYVRAKKYGLPEIDKEIAARIGHLATKRPISTPTEALEPGGDPKSAERDRWIKMLSHQNPSLRNEAVKKLGELGDRAAVPHLIKMLKDKDWLMRVTAAKSLGALGDRSAVPALIEKLTDPFPMVPLVAAEQLQKLTGRRGLGDSYAKWRRWYEEHREAFAAIAGGPGTEATEKKPDPTFKSTVILINERARSIVLSVPNGVSLKKGDVLGVYKNGDRACTLVVSGVSAGVAMGDLQNVSSKVKLKDDDPVTVKLVGDE